ncbi:MAG: leucyl aminopeptidase [Parcubacteria group bacterium Gr01-1014_18]|nr:MAG: leucyl aminopeptidase [Parcubacteria group bacterium Greene0416_36]TSC81268.1 MAG: leucyl aminopeptidase [Parcubacteria group bacterium Gr01-1014_18]TSC99290.1 MAG: leucyl aminopeptidase [Parcubacteria group bacterium Greene1014_20]TSD06873.1 MAG: leucyl aminopeptidase [Parcubacteria group bacterium Greene0714_2]
MSFNFVYICPSCPFPPFGIPYKNTLLVLFIFCMQITLMEAKVSANHAKYIPIMLSVGKEKTDGWVVEGEKKSLALAVADPKKLNRRSWSMLIRRVISMAKAHHVKNICLNLVDFKFSHLKMSWEDLVEEITVNLKLANFEFVRYKTKPEEGWNWVKEVALITPEDSSRRSPATRGTEADKSAKAEIKKGLERGVILADEINNTRVLANTPGGDITPESLAEEAIKAAKGLPIKVEVLGVEKMTELKMGGLLGVGKGSHFKPRFIIMEYFGGKKSEKPVVMVGKGVTFDTGGLSLKPAPSLLDMHMDMSGGAACIHALVAAAKLKVKKNLVVLVPAAENMVSGESYRPNDILTMMSGKTVEVLNTDAEGRIILADGLHYAHRYAPRLIVDVATLTGASLAALGQYGSGIFTKDESLSDKFCKWGEEVGNRVWPLPLWDEFADEIKSSFADLSNIGSVRWGDASHAAAFLSSFAGDFPWIHLDMAPRMVATKADHLAKGAMGEPVRLLVKVMENY